MTITSEGNEGTFGLCGHVYVDISTSEKQRAFELARATLEAVGWKTAGSTPHFKVVRQGEEVDGQTAIVCCVKEPGKLGKSAIEPDAYEVLRVIGACEIEEALCASVSSDIVVDKVVVGLNWTMVRAGNLCGIARSQSRGTEGARTIRPPEGFAGKTLKELASYLLSVDALSRSVGLAAINAYWNREELPEVTDAQLSKSGGFASVTPPGQGLVIVGGFREVQRRLPSAKIMEREPKPGDVPVEQARRAYREADVLAITAQTLMNGSLQPILIESEMVPRRMLVGPSAPLCPALLQLGLQSVSGLVINDPEAIEAFIVEAGTMIMLDHLASNMTLEAREGKVDDTPSRKCCLL